MYQIVQEKCTQCLNCLQQCPVFAVELNNRAVTINSTRCIDCGRCHRSCVHDAVAVFDETDVLEELLSGNRPVVVSIDPECRMQLPKSTTLEQLAGALKQLGVWAVADASIAIEAVICEYAELVQERRMKNIILSDCPVVQNLIEQYYPTLLPYLAPVASAMIAHGRILKRKYTGVAVVHISTNTAKIRESKDVRHSTEINAVLTVSQLLSWLEKKDIMPERCEPYSLLSDLSAGAVATTPEGILSCVRSIVPLKGWRKRTANSVEDCRNLLDLLLNESEAGYLLALKANEERFTHESAFSFADQFDLEVDERANLFFKRDDTVAMSNPSISRTIEPYQPDEMQIQEMMYHIGVGNLWQQKNCGMCGYSTCRERAEAILCHKEKATLCSWNVQSSRADMYSVLFKQMPIAALLVDETQRVVKCNKEACELFSIRGEQEKYIFELMDPVDFQYVLDTGLAIKNRRMDIPEIYMRVEATLVPIRELNMVLGLFQDITDEEEEEAALQRARLQSVEIAQRVIEKQMTVAQQIAFLLGETTAETKVTLNQLKLQILGEELNL